MRRWLVPSLVSVSALVLGLASPAGANHAWAKYHWGKSVPFTIVLGDNLSAPWGSFLDKSSEQWSESTVLDATVGTGAGNDNCGPVQGRVEVCNAAYGANGWLGIARIWATRDGHITQGVVELNDTYYAQERYNTDGWRQFVMCQEIGHTFGLGHVNEVFTNENTGSCMDYTNDPTGTAGTNGTLANLAPNAHDYEQLESIYAHQSGTGSTRPGGGKGGGKKAGQPADWGRPISAGGPHGHADEFEKDLGDGTKVITHVFWADHDHAHEH